jgi:hypothetical protein
MHIHATSIAPRAMAFAAAGALLGTSIWYAVGEGDLGRLLAARAGDVTILLGLTFASAIVLVSQLFWLASRPFADPERPLRWWEMQPITAASILLNYTPLKIGLIGRIAYLRQYHGIGYLASGLSHFLLAAALGASLVLLAALTVWRSDLDFAWWVGLSLGCAASGGLISIGVKAFAPRPLAEIVQRSFLGGPWLRSSMQVSAWCAVSCGLVLLGAVRWCVAFRIYGKPVSLREALLISIVHQLAAALGPANGLGLREWLVGLVAGSGFLGMAAVSGLQVGVAVSIIDRAAEVLVVVPAGLLGIAWLAHRRRAGDPVASVGGQQTR